MKYRLEKLNQVQFADNESRKKELEAKGFKLVGRAEDSESGVFAAGSSVEKPVDGDNDAEKPKAAKKKTVAKGEDKDAGENKDQAGIVRLPEE